MQKPLLICLTSTRNYAWVTKAFLKANSIWADYIIIVDQMSTDGTKELALSYPNVILIENEDLTYSETKRVELAVNRARQIKGDKILFYLAIDEVLSANYVETKDWGRILNSAPRDVFCLTWANLLPDKKSYFQMCNSSSIPSWMARVFHDDGITPYDNEGLDMHTHCIPYPKKDFHEYLVADFKILHFAFFNEQWDRAKQRYYQFVDFDKNKRTATSLSRMYHQNIVREARPIPSSWLYLKTIHGFDLFDEIDMSMSPFLDLETLNFIKKNGMRRYRKLDVWDKQFLEKFDLKDPRNNFIKLFHFYLKLTRNYSKTKFVRMIDKILKVIGA